MLNLLPYEILILIFNYLIPFEIILPYNDDPIYIKKENNTYNIILIRTSNQIFCNLALCNKILKKIIYEKCLKSIYFKKNINVKLIFIFKPCIIYAPHDETLTEEDLRLFYENDIKLKEIYVERNSLIKDFKINCPSLENYKNTWIPLFLDKFAGNTNCSSNELTKKIKNTNDLINNNYKHFRNEKAIKKFFKLYPLNHPFFSYYFDFDLIKHDIKDNFYSFDLYVDNYLKESYLIININSSKLLKSIEENIPVANLRLLINACRNDIFYKGIWTIFGRPWTDKNYIFDLGLLYFKDNVFYKYN